MNIPLVSVVLSVYNGEKYLMNAIESILDQTYPAFEFIIVNDGSTDNSPKIIDKYRKLDNRIKVLNQKNRGLIDSLNRGLALANGRYIARMDSDDISLPSKLEEQYNYLENNPDIGVLGTWIEMINEDGKPLKLWESPTSNHLIEWSLFFKTAWWLTPDSNQTSNISDSLSKMSFLHFLQRVPLGMSSFASLVNHAFEPSLSNISAT